MSYTFGKKEERGSYMKFEGPLYAVRSMAVSRAFYEQVMGRTVAMDLGANLVFAGGPTLQEGFGALVGFPEEKTQYRAYNGELYFETTTFEEDVARIKAAGVELLHDKKEYPWGQHTLRFFDPDGHIIELGEPMDFVAARFLLAGMSVEETAKKTQFPIAIVEKIKANL